MFEWDLSITAILASVFISCSAGVQGMEIGIDWIGIGIRDTVTR
jgi:hypothetical protein